MKKAFSFFLLFLFLLNALGFYGIFLGLQFKTAQEANAALDQERYSDSEALTFKIPVTVPYSSDQSDFVRVTGEFERNGEVFRLIKQKLSHDTLYVVCMKDSKSGKINEAVADYVKTFTDKPLSAKQSTKHQLSSFSKDYLITGVSVESRASGWKNELTYGESTRNYSSSHESRIKYPPRPFFFS